MTSKSTSPEPSSLVMQAKQAGKRLTMDKIAAIQLYTQESSLYQQLNKQLPKYDHSKAVPFLPFTKLFLTALYKLLAKSHNVWPGVKSDLSKHLSWGKEKTWWAFSSCTGKLEVLENGMFMGKLGHCTMFHIRAMCVYNISMYLAIPKEVVCVLVCASSKHRIGGGECTQYRHWPGDESIALSLSVSAHHHWCCSTPLSIPSDHNSRKPAAAPAN